MMNPWLDYDYEDESTIHPLDRDSINEFNARLESKDESTQQAFTISTTHTALPFFGSIDSKLVILAANPGLKIGETDLEETAKRRQLFDLARRHELAGNPFVFLRPEFEGTPGHDWWTARTRVLRDAIGDDVFTSNTFAAEIHPYKSVKYRSLGSAIATQRYTAELVSKNVSNGAWVIVLRARGEWNLLVPELVDNPKVFQLNSTQNSHITPANMAPGLFDLLVGELTSKETLARAAKLSRSPSQNCPNCDAPVKSFQRYPRYLCRKCAGRTVDAKGRRVWFTNFAFDSGAIVMHFADSVEPEVVIGNPWANELANVWVDELPCEVRAAHYGGIVVQAIA
jgi:hypothetical protein